MLARSAFALDAEHLKNLSAACEGTDIAFAA
jgi:hypothetical protein